MTDPYRYGNCLLYALGSWLRSGCKGKIVDIGTQSAHYAHVLNGYAHHWRAEDRENVRGLRTLWFRGRPAISVYLELA